MRLGSNVSADGRNQRVESIINELGLQKCCNTIIGSAMLRGISGGERRRVAIGRVSWENAASRNEIFSVYGIYYVFVVFTLRDGTDYKPKNSVS